MANEVTNLHTHFCETWNKKWKDVVIRVPQYFVKTDIIWKTLNILQNDLSKIFMSKRHHDILYVSCDENTIQTITCYEFSHTTSIKFSSKCKSSMSRKIMNVDNVRKCMYRCLQEVAMDALLFNIEMLLTFVGYECLLYCNSHDINQCLEHNQIIEWREISHDLFIEWQNTYIECRFLHVNLLTIHEYQSKNYALNSCEMIFADSFLVMCIGKY